MNYDEEQKLIREVKQYISDNLTISGMSDDDLEENIEKIVASKLNGIYCSIEQRVSIVDQVFSSIRGLGLLDTIMMMILSLKL